MLDRTDVSAALLIGAHVVDSVGGKRKQITPPAPRSVISPFVTVVGRHLIADSTVVVCYAAQLWPAGVYWSFTFVCVQTCSCSSLKRLTEINER